MMDEILARQSVRDGTRVVYIDEPGWYTKLAWAEGDALLTVEFDGPSLYRTRRDRFVDDPFRQLRTDWWSAWLRDPVDVPVYERARAMERHVQALLVDLRERDAWLPLEHDFVLYDDALDFLRVFTSGTIRARPCDWFYDELYRQVWRNPELALVAPPFELPQLAEVRAQLSRLEAGTHGIARDGAIAIGFDGAFFDLRLDGDRIGEETLFNPFMAKLPRAKVIERLFDGATLAPAKLDLSRLAVALRQTRAQIVDAYVARIRAGMTISGGPTTDQSWTVSSDGTKFFIRSYAPVDEGYEQRIDPLAEDTLRSMLSTYRMFGLADLP